jgi:hypothetical protein
VSLFILILYPLDDTKSVFTQDRGIVDALHHHPRLCPLTSAHLLRFWMSVLLFTFAAIQQEPYS